MNGRSQKLNIIVEGASGSGKTHLAAYIAKILKTENYDVKISVPEINDYDIVGFGNASEIQSSIKDQSTLNITTGQLRR